MNAKNLTTTKSDDMLTEIKELAVMDAKYYEDLEYVIRDCICDSEQMRRFAQGMRTGLELRDEPEKLQQYIDAAFKRWDELYELERAEKRRNASNPYWGFVDNAPA